MQLSRSQLLSLREVAIRIGAAEDTVVTWVQNGMLPAQMADGMYRFAPEDVAAFANSHPDGNPPGDGIVNDLVRRPDDTAVPGR
jgi:excisionase family DNA binding protein